MKPSKAQFVQAVGKLNALAMFPSDPNAQEAIMGILSKMVSTVAQLNWLIDAMLNQVGTWYGPKEMRGVFCTRFKPADRIEAECAHTLGFTPGDCETENLLKHEQNKISHTEANRMLEGLKGEVKN